MLSLSEMISLIASTGEKREVSEFATMAESVAASSFPASENHCFNLL